MALGLAILPRAVGGPTDAEGAQGPHLRVLTVNLRRGGADPAAMVALARDTRADVLALQEVDADAMAKLDAAGLGELLPHRVVRRGNSFHGTVLLARAARDPLPPVDGVVTPMARARLGRVELVAVHTMAPQGPGRVRGWEHDMRALPGAGGALRVLAGDFNSTLDHAELRRLIGTGYEDAAEQVGAGLRPTWPVGGRRPPVTIDHVLADPRTGVRAVATHRLPDTDHRAFFAESVLPAE